MIFINEIRNKYILIIVNFLRKNKIFKNIKRLCYRLKI